MAQGEAKIPTHAESYNTFKFNRAPRAPEGVGGVRWGRGQGQDGAESRGVRGACASAGLALGPLREALGPRLQARDGVAGEAVVVEVPALAQLGGGRRRVGFDATIV